MNHTRSFSKADPEALVKFFLERQKSSDDENFMEQF